MLGIFVSSGAIASSAAVTSVPALVNGITLRTGTTASSVTLRNGGSGGTILWALSNVGTTAAGDTTVSIVFAEPIIFGTDVYATIAGTDAVAYVSYKKV